MPTVTQNEVNLLKQKEKLQEKINDLEAKQGRLSQAERGKLKELAVQMDTLDVSLTSVTSKFDMAIKNLSDLAKSGSDAKMAFEKLGATNVDKDLRKIAEQSNKSAESIASMVDKLKTLNAQGQGQSKAAAAIESSLAIESDILGIYDDKSKLLTSNLISLEAEVELAISLLDKKSEEYEIELNFLTTQRQRVQNLQTQQSRAKTLNDVESKGAEIQKKIAEFASNFASAQGTALIVTGALVKVLQFAANETRAVQEATGGTIGNSAALAANFRANLGTTQNLLGTFTGVNSKIRDAAFEAGKVADNMDLANNMAIGVSDATLAMQTGLSSTQVAELAQMMSEVTDVSREGASAQLVTVQALAQANKVNPSKVFASMAQNATVLASMTDGSAESMGKLAVQAAKAGVELSSLESIADSLLNIETSIAAEFEAEVLLGRQLNLDAARRFALNNDNEGLIREIQKNLQGTSFSDLNRLQRQSLAAALGVNVADLGRIISRSGNQNVVDVQDQQLKGLMELNAQGSLTNDLLGQIYKAVFAIAAVQAVGGLSKIAESFKNFSGGGILNSFGKGMQTFNRGGGPGFGRTLLGNASRLKGPAALAALTAIPELIASQDKVRDGAGIFGRIGGGIAAGAGLGALGMNPYTVIGGGILGGIFGEAAVEGLVDLFRGGFANGGPVTESGLAMVGERGPELVALGRGSHVVPNHYLGGYQGGATNMKISDPDTHRALMTIASHLESINTNTANTTKGVNNIGIATGA